MPNVFVFGTEERPEKDAAEQDTPSAMGPLPPEEDRLFDAMLEKQVTAGQLGWQMRRLVLTSNALIFARPGVSARHPSVGSSRPPSGIILCSRARRIKLAD